jgi:hypothetical protein
MSRPPWPLAALAVLAVIVAGCGNTSAARSNGTADAHEKAVKFAECMRANGVRAFPDPNVSGEVTIDAVANGSLVDTRAPRRSSRP